jgi:NAD(P)-dependent dehydrogenase (short-subunit alcohol dehydrogenase family)
MARHALVTGANRGIGLEFVRQLLARGDPQGATALNTLAGEYPGRLRVLPLDVALEKSRAELVRELPLVCERLDLLVNNAGVLHSGERFGQLSQASLEDSLRVNALGPLLVTEALAPTLADGARVANVSSMMSSLATRREFRSPGYCMGKAAQNMATVQLAHALRPRGIVVLALCPGWVQTDMGGEGAQITPAQSVEGLLRVIDGAGADDSGRFIDWRGEAMAW